MGVVEVHTRCMELAVVVEGIKKTLRLMPSERLCMLLRIQDLLGEGVKQRRGCSRRRCNLSGGSQTGGGDYLTKAAHLAFASASTYLLTM